MRFCRMFAIALLLALLAGQAHAILPGQVAPDFSLVDVQGNAHRLSAHRGQVVLLAFIGWS